MMSEQWKRARYLSNCSRFFLVRLSLAFIFCPLGRLKYLFAVIVGACLHTLAMLYVLAFASLYGVPSTSPELQVLWQASAIIAYMFGVAYLMWVCFQTEHEVLTSDTLHAMNTYPWSKEARHVLARVVCSNNVLQMQHLAEVLRAENRNTKKSNKAAEREGERRVQEYASLHAEHCEPMVCKAS